MAKSSGYDTGGNGDTEPEDPIVVEEVLNLSAVMPEKSVYSMKADRKFSFARVGELVTFNYFESSGCSHVGEAKMAVAGKNALFSSFFFTPAANEACKAADAAQAAMRLIVRTDDAPVLITAKSGSLVLGVENGNGGGILDFERIGTTSSSKDLRAAMTGSWNFTSSHCTVDSSLQPKSKKQELFRNYKFDLVSSDASFSRTRPNGDFQEGSEIIIGNVRENDVQFNATLSMKFQWINNNNAYLIYVRLVKGMAPELRLTQTDTQSNCPYGGVTYVFNRGPK